MKSGNVEKVLYGEAFKLFRTSKKFTLKEAAGNDTSSANISKFENGISSPSVETFFNIINNINVSAFEFQNLYNQMLNSKDIMLYESELIAAYMSNDKDKVCQFIEKLKMLSLTFDSKKYKLDKVQAEAVLAKIDREYKIPEEDILFLKTYLLELEDWGIYDINALTRSDHIFDPVTLSKLTQQMLKANYFNKKLPEIRRAKIQALLNIVNAFVRNKQWELAEKYISYLENMNIEDYYTFEKNILKYNKANYRFHRGDDTALVIMEKCRDVFEYCDCNSYALLMSKEIKELKRVRR